MPDDEEEAVSWTLEEPNETTWAQGRQPHPTYASTSFDLNRPGSSDHGQPARVINKVFDPETETELDRSGDEWTICPHPRGVNRFKLLVARASRYT
jgi:hypothetical protein